MKVSYISDLHLDFRLKPNNVGKPHYNKLQDDFIKNTLKPTDAEVLIIAGDLGHYFNQDKDFLLKIKEYFDHVLLVFGNHDLYLVSKNLQKKYNYNSFNRIIEMKEFCETVDGLHYLDGDMIEINGKTFGGVGMSWDTSYLEVLNKKYNPNNPDTYNLSTSRSHVNSLFKSSMNDARMIMTNRPTPMTGWDSVYSSRLARQGSDFNPFEHLNSELDKLKTIEHVDVMISHYAPVIPPGMREEYALAESTTFYYFDGSDALKRISPKFWVYGHTHDKYNFMVNNTNFLCNPLGYPGENNSVIIESFEI